MKNFATEVYLFFGILAAAFWNLLVAFFTDKRSA